MFSLMSVTGFAANLKYDVNGDEKVNVFDAVYILNECTKTSRDKSLDVNGDSYVNAFDALHILKICAGLIKEDPVDEPDVPDEQTDISILDDYSSKWIYNTLPDNQKKAYIKICDGIKSCKASIDISDCKIKEDEYNIILAAVRGENPHAFATQGNVSYYREKGYMASLKYTYNMTAAQNKSTMSSIEKITADVIAEAKTLKSDYEKALLFHDWIINRTDYISNGEKYTWRMDGPIIQRKSVCEGYSKAFTYLCQSVGIECFCVTGTGNGGAHMWNMVKIDGTWYHADVTWDDPISWDGRPILKYDYFLISEGKIKQDHTIENNFKRPSAPYSYY